MEELGVIVGLAIIGFLMGFFNIGMKWVFLTPIAVIISCYIRKIVFILLLISLIPGMYTLVILSFIIFTALLIVCSVFSYVLAKYVRTR